MKCKVLFLLMVVSVGAFAQEKAPNMGVVPAPASVKASKDTFLFAPETIVIVDSPSHKAIKFFADYLKKENLATSVTNRAWIKGKKVSVKNTVTLLLDFKDKLPEDGYELKIEENSIELKGRGAGMFYGIQTLIQLMHKTSVGYAKIPCGTIKDSPRFPYRGMHLDVARHFFDVDFVKKYIDVMAMYKLNIFHWHLTDDQGWRIEIKKYPKLTEIGSKRAQTKIGRAAGPKAIKGLYDNTPYGGYYTQEQIKEVVDYASARYITIVPEIDMPAHSLAALAAYPEWSCDPKKEYKVGETWGGFDDVFCPTPETFKALYEILREVMDLFPGKYIHIGGDECNKVAWKKSGYCRQLIADEKLNNTDGLQSYFVRKIEKYVNSQGRSVIGWDEILEGGLAPNATIMSWRGEKGGIAAAQLGHDAIMTPGSGGMYFDHVQSRSDEEPLSIGGHAPIEKTYAYDPIPSVLNKQQAKHIIGVQANLWTEYIATPSKAEYMLLPRMLAMAETGWSEAGNKDYKNFAEARLPYQLALLDAAGYNYRVPVPIGAADTVLKGDKFSIELKPSVEGAKVYYTIDGANPTVNDLVYTAPIQLAIPVGGSISFRSVVITESGKKSVTTTIKMENKK